MGINKRYENCFSALLEDVPDFEGTLSYIPNIFEQKIKGIYPKYTEISQQIKKRPGTDFVSTPGSFMVAEAGLEPTTSGL